MRSLLIGMTILTLGLNVAARETYTVNDGWTFRFAEDTIAARRVAVPHSWNSDAYVTRDYRRGEGVYERMLNIPERLRNNRIYLKLDGAASKSRVLVDGKETGTHVGAYSPHVVDLTPYVEPGGTHRLTVYVDNSDPAVPPYSADFTFMGGLYRDVWIVAVDDVHLSPESGRAEGVKVESGLSASGAGLLAVSGDLINASDKKRKITVSSEILAPSGEVMASRSATVNLKPESDGTFRLDFGSIEGVEPWSPESPVLYELVTEVRDGGKVLDSTRTSVGFRSFGFDDEGRFLLNGSPYKLRGMCRHQDQRPMGIALTDEQHRRDMKLIKDMGANFIRISHYPQDDAVLEMCDRLGLIAWEEIPVIDYVPDTPGFDENAETMVREMIRSHYNHPSVAMWGYMNEILLRTPADEREATRKRTKLLADRLEEVVKEEDASRMSAMAFHGSDVYHEAGLGEITDVKGWNLYQGWYGGDMTEFEKFLSRQHAEHPSYRLIVSEYGAGSDLRLHSLKPEPFDFSMEYQQQYLEHYLPVIEDSAFVAGASHWNFIDFSSANRAESMPHINNKGLVTNDRRKKDVYHYYQAAWTPSDRKSVAHIASRDWAERTEIVVAGDTVMRPVKIYTNLPVVTLTVNGTALPETAVANYTAVFDVPLKKGRNVLELHSSSVASDDTLDTMTIDVNLIPVRGGKIVLGEDELAINVGSNCYFRSEDSGLTWLPDMEYGPGGAYGYVGGRRNVSQDEIGLTNDGPLYQRSLSELEEYRIDVEDGEYELELGFADLSAPSALSAYMLGHNAGKATSASRMDIAVNGVTVEDDFSPALESGVKNMVKRRYLTKATDGEGITVSFTPDEGLTLLSTIKIRRL